MDDSQATLSLHKLVTQTSEIERIRDYSKPQAGLKAALLDHIQEIETELETSAENLSEQAVEHIHSSELILTLGHSRTVESFLKTAAKQRKFEVVVAECAPACRVSLTDNFVDFDGNINTSYLRKNENVWYNCCCCCCCRATH